MSGVINFAQSLKGLVRVTPEHLAHPHVPEEKPELFHSAGSGAAELEVLTFLNALVYLFKPTAALETGTGSGLSSLAIASALAANGRGHLHTLERDPGVSSGARDTVASIDASLLPQISFHAASSLDWIESTRLGPFDFAFFDSLIAVRHLEFERLRERGLLFSGAVCVFHDTSRLRGQYYEDFSADAIASLDAASSGGQWLECGLSRGVRVLKLG